MNGADIVWRGFTRAELDRAYSPSSMIESIGVFLDAYRERSAAVREALRESARIGLAYGPGAEQTLDWFPAAGEGRPILVFVHGGYWQALSKDDSAFAAAAFVAHGIDFVAVNYTLAPHATSDAIVAEIRAAVAWIRRTATAMGGDPDRVVVAGHSAGAHLAAMLATPGTEADAAPAALVLLGGVYDLEPIRLSYVNDPLGLDAAAVAQRVGGDAAVEHQRQDAEGVADEGVALGTPAVRRRVELERREGPEADDDDGTPAELADPFASGDNAKPVASAADDEIAPVGDKKWYILKVQSNREDSISDTLERRIRMQGLDRYFGKVIVPKEQVTEFKSGKKRVVSRKLYPGYILVNMILNDETWYLVRETGGIGDFTGSAGRPSPMLPADVDKLLNKSAVKPDEAPRLKINFKKGDRVKITEGTFENFEGEVEQIDEANGRVTVMLSIFGRSTPVDIEYWQIEGI